MSKKIPEALSEEDFINKVQPPEEVVYLRSLIKKRDSVIERQRGRIGELEDVSQLFSGAIRALPPPKSFNYRLPKKKDKTPSMATLCLSDFHAEETIDFEEMEGYARFDWNIFLARAWQTVTKTVEIVDLERHGQEIKDLTVFLMGDMVTGDIHADGERTASMPLPIAIVELADIIAQMLNFLSEHFETVRVVGVCGNHGRKDLKPVSKQKADRNWDTSCYHIARKITRDNDRIEWILPKSPAVVIGSLGVDFLVKHGDGIRSRGVTPYYGLVRDTSREMQKRRKIRDFDYVVQGHLHHFGVVEGNRILCPSLIGPNQYSYNLLHSTYPPEQLLLFTSENYGLIDIKPIKLDAEDNHGFISDCLVTTDLGWRNS